MLLPGLSDSARVWMFASRTPFTSEAGVGLTTALSEFISAWSSHGRKVDAQSVIVENQVLIVGAHISDNEANAGVSGCGIDKLEHAVRDIAQAHGLSWTSALDIVYERGDGSLACVSRSQLRSLLEAGQVDMQTRVVDTTQTSLRAIRDHGILRPASETWVSKAFSPIETAA